LQLLEAVPTDAPAVKKAPYGMGDAFVMGIRRGDFSSPGKHIGCNGYIPNITRNQERRGCRKRQVRKQ
jgi:hypothetical protein